jgi:hypothetical protein
MKIYEHNVETGEAAERDMTAAELAQYELDKARAEAAAEAEALAVEAKQAAEAKLAALGLTVEDLKALGL